MPALNEANGFQRDLPFIARAWDGWLRFWFQPTEPTALHVVRVLTGVVLLWWWGTMGVRLNEFHGPSALFDLKALAEAARLPSVPSETPIGWSPIYLIRSPIGLWTLYGAVMVNAVLWTLGFWTRVTSIGAWLGVVAFTSNPALSFGGDSLLLVLTYCLMLGYFFHRIEDLAKSPMAILGSSDAILWRWLREPTAPSVGANLGVRLVQVHVALIVAVTGVHKLQLSVWWSGVAYWFPLHAPFETSVEAIEKLSNQPGAYMSILSLAAYTTLAWQIGFPFMAWRANCRPLVLAGGVIGWLGCAFVYQLPVFGPTLAIGCLSFVDSMSWRHWLIALSRLRQRSPASSSQTSIATLTQAPSSNVA